MTEQEKEYNEWHQQHADDNGINTPWHESVKRNISFGNDIKGRKILEIACGRGAFSNYLAFHKPIEIWACDYAEKAIELGAKEFGTHSGLIHWKKENIENLSFEDNYFDTIISCETIEHLPHPYLGLKELHRVLKPGGKIYLTCPNYFNFFGLWCIYRWMIGKPYTEGGQAYVNYALMPKVFYWCKMAGFSVIKFHSADFVLPLRKHFHFFKKELRSVFRIFGLQTFYILKKK